MFCQELSRYEAGKMADVRHHDHDVRRIERQL
jgi:hypothetical protein